MPSIANCLFVWRIKINTAYEMGLDYGSQLNRLTQTLLLAFSRQTRWCVLMFGSCINNTVPEVFKA